MTMATFYEEFPLDFHDEVTPIRPSRSRGRAARSGRAANQASLARQTTVDDIASNQWRSDGPVCRSEWRPLAGGSLIGCHCGRRKMSVPWVDWTPDNPDPRRSCGRLDCVAGSRSAFRFFVDEVVTAFIGSSERSFSPDSIEAHPSREDLVDVVMGKVNRERVRVARENHSETGQPAWFHRPPAKVPVVFTRRTDRDWLVLLADGFLWGEIEIRSNLP